MATTYAGATIGLVAAAPSTYDAAGYAALTFVTGTCALHAVPAISREWAKVTETLVCATSNDDLKGSSKYAPVTYMLSSLEGDPAQALYIAAEAAGSGVASVYSFNITLPGGSGIGGDLYFRAQVSKFALIDGGSQDTIHTRSVELLIQTSLAGAPLWVVAA